MLLFLLISHTYRTSGPRTDGPLVRHTHVLQGFAEAGYGYVDVANNIITEAAETLVIKKVIARLLLPNGKHD